MVVSEINLLKTGAGWVGEKLEADLVEWVCLYFHKHYSHVNIELTQGMSVFKQGSVL